MLTALYDDLETQLRIWLEWAMHITWTRFIYLFIFFIEFLFQVLWKSMTPRTQCSSWQLCGIQSSSLWWSFCKNSSRQRHWIVRPFGEAGVKVWELDSLIALTVFFWRTQATQIVYQHQYRHWWEQLSFPSQVSQWVPMFCIFGTKREPVSDLITLYFWLFVCFCVVFVFAFYTSKSKSFLWDNLIHRPFGSQLAKIEKKYISYMPLLWNL